MTEQETGSTPNRSWSRRLQTNWRSSIRTKIVLPYFLLTLVVAAVGAYVVTWLVSASLEERLQNRLIDSGRAVSDAVVDQEETRLEVERLIAFTQGLPQAITAEDYAELARLVTPIASNANQIDSVIVVDGGAREILRLTRTENVTGEPFAAEIDSQASFQDWPVVRQALQGQSDSRGDKYTQFASQDDAPEIILYTIGPVRQGDSVVGAILVGTLLDNVLRNLKEISQADVTVYESTGLVLDTTYGGGQQGMKDILAISAQRYDTVLAEGKVSTPLDSRDIFGRSYRLAYSPFVLRGELIGVFSVGWPEDFLVQRGTTSRNLFTILFFIATVAVIGIGALVTRQILHPIGRLVSTTQEIIRGNLSQRTGIQSPDEIGRLAVTFDEMTTNLEIRTQELERLLQLQEEEATKTQAILSSIADGVIVQNREGEIITMNPAARQILDSLAEDLGNTQIERLPFDPDEILSGALVEVARRFKVGKSNFSAVAAPVVTAHGDTLGMVVVLRDITREVESEQLKNRFIESISHELLTPLVPIKGFTDLLLMTTKDKLNPRQHQNLVKIKDNVDDLHEMIATLIDVSQIEGSSLGLERKRFRLDELISLAYEQWLPTMQQRELDFRLNLPRYTALWILADQARIRRALNYLLSNAANYSPGGGEVEVRVTVRDDQVQVDVRDTGVGIAESAQRYIFTRFYRALPEDLYGIRGAGLGLYLTRAIVEHHDGQIWFESEENKGSTFSFALPLESVARLDNIDQAVVVGHDGLKDTKST
jgi:signal transduction histidine kinase